MEDYYEYKINVGTENISHYYPSENLLRGDNGFAIDISFYHSKSFMEILIKTMLEDNYRKIFENYLMENLNINLDVPAGINDILDYIGDINFIKDIAIRADGKICNINMRRDDEDADSKLDRITSNIIFFTFD